MNLLKLAFGVVLVCLGAPVDAFHSLFMKLGASGGAMTDSVPLNGIIPAFLHVVRADLPPMDGVDVPVDMTEVAGAFGSTYDALVTESSKPGGVLSSSALHDISPDQWVLTAAALIGFAYVLDTRQSVTLLKGEVVAAGAAVDEARAALGSAQAVSDAKDLVFSQQTESIGQRLDVATNVIATVHADIEAAVAASMDREDATIGAIRVSVMCE